MWEGTRICFKSRGQKLREEILFPLVSDITGCRAAIWFLWFCNHSLARGYNECL